MIQAHAGPLPSKVVNPIACHHMLIDLTLLYANITENNWVASIELCTTCKSYSFAHLNHNSFCCPDKHMQCLLYYTKADPFYLAN